MAKQIKGLRTSGDYLNALAKTGTEKNSSIGISTNTLQTGLTALNTLGNVMMRFSDNKVRIAEVSAQIEMLKTESATKLGMEKERTKQVFAQCRLEYERIQADSFIKGKALDNEYIKNEQLHKENMVKLKMVEERANKVLDMALSQVQHLQMAMQVCLDEYREKPDINMNTYLNLVHEVTEIITSHNNNVF